MSSGSVKARPRRHPTRWWSSDRDGLAREAEVATEPAPMEHLCWGLGPLTSHMSHENSFVLREIFFCPLEFYKSHPCQSRDTLGVIRHIIKIFKCRTVYWWLHNLIFSVFVSVPGRTRRADARL